MVTLILPLMLGSVVADPACIWNQSGGAKPIVMPDSNRSSPRDSVTFSVGGTTVKVCYSRPSLKGRHMVGGEAVPFGKVWRTGANEATMIHTTGPISIAGISVKAGTYALYTVPGEKEWEIIVNRSYMQWGHERMYSDSVKAQEVGRGKAAAQKTDKPTEKFTIRSETAGAGANLILEWENARVVVPIKKG